MGRKKLPESVKRNTYICFTATREEIKMILRKSKEHGVRKSTLIRMAIEKY